MNGFLTVEDINTMLLKYKDIPFWDTVNIDTGDNIHNFSDIKFDYCNVSRTYNNGKYTFVITVENSLFGIKNSNSYYLTYINCFDTNNNFITNITRQNKTFTVVSDTHNISLTVYLSNWSLWKSDYIFGSGINPQWKIKNTQHKIVNNQNEYHIELESLQTLSKNNFTILFYKGTTYEYITSRNFTFQNNTLIFKEPTGNFDSIIIRYENVVYQIPIPSNKQINVVQLPQNQTLTVGEINTFTISSDSSNLNIESNYPVTIENKTVTLDLTDKENLKPVSLTISTIGDDTYYPNEFKFNIPCKYPIITSETELKTFISNGGSIARLGDDITLTEPLTLSDDLLIIGNDNTIDLDGNNIIVEKTFKAENTIFINGVNTILQRADSTVELTECTFNNCHVGDISLGSCICCDVEFANLSLDDDFTTDLKQCTFNDNDSCIYHSGNLTIDGCTVINCGHVGYPQLLYQTDGTAYVANSEFQFTKTCNVDIMYMACLVEIGENATFNGAGHTELMNNDTLPFFDQNNHSLIDCTYYYPSIEGNVRLYSNNGVCHAVSGVDWVYKNCITLTRGD